MSWPALSLSIRSVCQAALSEEKTLINYFALVRSNPPNGPPNGQVLLRLPSRLATNSQHRTHTAHFHSITLSSGSVQYTLRTIFGFVIQRLNSYH
jgi:hypothetical protein